MSRPWMLLSAVLVAHVAQAAQTGNVTGFVSDGEGLPIPGAEVRLTGSDIAGELVATTDEEGRFRFGVVPIGVHDLVVTKAGFSGLTAEITVASDRNTYVPATLISGSTEEIVVEGVKPTVDATRSAFSTEMGADLFQNLPVGRSYQSVLQLAPGVSGRVDTATGGPGDGNPSVRGEGQYGNNFLLDGISTRDPATKTFGSNVNFDAVESIQVFTDGMPAEYGQGSGMVVNVVTKDGGDEHFGSIGYWFGVNASPGTYDILNFETGEEEPTAKRRFMNHEVSATAGGPLVKEKLWYFAALAIDANRTRFEGASEDDDPYVSAGPSGFAKVTWFPTTSTSLQYQIGFDLAAINAAETSGQFAEEAQSNRRDGGQTHILTGRIRPSPSSEVEFKASYLQTFINVVPASGDEAAPMIFDAETGEYTNNYEMFDYNRRSRVGASVKYSQLIENLLGTHRFKIGLEGWQLLDEREIINTGVGSAPDAQAFDEDGEPIDWVNQGYRFTRNTSAGFPCTAEAGYADCEALTEYVNVGAIGSKGVVFGGFVQDDWTVADRLTVNAGVRVDHELLLNNGEPRQKVISQTMPAPRLGVVWDITGDNRTKASLNAGRYYDLNGNTYADWAATRNAAVYGQFENNGSGYGRVFLQDPQAEPLIYCTEDSLNAIADGAHPEIEEAARTACGDRVLRPYHMDKLAIGFEREIIKDLAIGVRGILSETRNLPEDVDWDLDAWVIANPEEKLRRYRALELTVNHRFNGRFQLLGSYTLSESKGHMPGEFELASGGSTGSNGNQVGVYMDDIYSQEIRDLYLDAGYGWLVDGLNGLGRPGATAGYYGYLPYHSFHNFKLSGGYTAPFGTTFSAVWEIDSGNAWQKRGYVDLYQDYMSLPEGRGVRFMPAVNYLDIRAAHKLAINDRQSVELTADVFNLLDLQTPITYYQNDNELFGKTMFRQSPRSVRLGARFSY